MRTIKIGQIFGMLEVMSLETPLLTPKGKPSRAYVICRCSCDKIKAISKGRLFRGDSKTCGKKECRKKSVLLANKERRLGKYGLTSDGYERNWDGHK